MPVTLGSLRPVCVGGVGLPPYQPLSETPYVQLGLSAARDALTDARVPWEFVDSAYVAQTLLPISLRRPLLPHPGAPRPEARVPWEFVDSAYVAKALLPMAVGRPMLRHLGATGLPITHVENASA